MPRIWASGQHGDAAEMRGCGVLMLPLLTPAPDPGTQRHRHPVTHTSTYKKTQRHRDTWQHTQTHTLTDTR